MKTTRALKIFSRILFFLSIFFITVFFSDWFLGPFFFNRNYRLLKYILCFIVPAIVTIFNFSQEKKLKFAGKCTAIIMSCFVLGIIVFNYFKIPWFSVYEMSSLYHLSYALICVFMVLVTATLIADIDNSASIHYNSFYNDFFLGYIPMLITLYILFYGNYRSSDAAYIINLVPFNGEIKTVLADPSSLSLMRTLGNILFYSTIALTVARFIKKRSALWAFVLPFLVSIITEFAQGIFSIGDADIDDVLLNSFGALIGALVYKFFIEKLRREKICSE